MGQHDVRLSLRRTEWNDLRQASSQAHGLFTTAEALDAGLTRSSLSRAVARGDLVRLATGVLCIPHLLDDHSHLAALCSSTPGAVASHRAAAGLLGLDGIEEEVVEISVPGSGRPRRPHVHRTSDMLPSDLIVIEGIRSTNATRTLCDLGSTCTAIAVERALESALRLRVTSMPKLAQRCDELARRGRVGPATLRGILGLRRDVEPTESEFETIALQRLRAAGVTDPIRQHVVRFEGRFVARLDAAWIAPMLYMELDSRKHHGTWAARVRDHERQNRLTAAGWAPLRYTWSDFACNGTAVAAEVMTIIASRMTA